MKLNEIYHGFKLVDLHEIQEIKSKAHIFLHEKTGAQLLYLKNDDPDKVFSVGFKTPPKDSTGVPHIVEHCVLSGSRKYKTKEPFMDMVKGSLKTFINAMTFSDKTIYPVASKNHKDFENLMDVYLDSVFFPMIYEDKTIFMQEGWHYSISEKEAPLKYNGVVYNEMRGAYSQPMTHLREHIGAALFPDNTYRYSSGGNPDEIYKLSYEDFTNFHKTYYQPSNAYFYLYGDGDVDSHLMKINNEYLSQFSNAPVDAHIELQKPFDAPKTVEGTYAVSESENLDQKTFLSVSYVLGESESFENQLIGDILKEILVSAEGAPLKEALLEKGIGQDILCSVSGGKQVYLSVIAKDAHADQGPVFKEVVESTLKKMMADKIDQDLLASALNVVEYDLKDIGTPTKGIIYYISALSSWLYGGHATATLSYNKTLEALRGKMNIGYYEGLIETLLLNNSHSAFVTLNPEKGLNEKKSQALEEHLKAYKNSLSESEIEALISENEILKKKQLTPDSEEARKTMPKINIKDVNKASEIIPVKIVENNVYKLFKHELFTNDILYMELLFDTRMVSKDQISFLPLLGEVLGKMNLENMSYADLNNKIYKETGGLNFTTRNYAYVDGSGFEPKMVVSGKVVKKHIPELMSLSAKLLTETVFKDEKRLKDLLQQHQSRIAMAIDNRGDQFASARVCSYFSNSSAYSELTRGFSYYWFISDLVKHFDEKKGMIIKTLEALYGQIFNQQNLIVSITGDESICQVVESNLPVLMEKVQNHPFEIIDYSFDLQAENEGVYSASNVQYVAKGFDFKKFNQKYHGSLEVLKSILNTDYLHDRIRAQNGAYGCGISFSSTGQVVATSFRDPKLKETLEIFEETANYLETLDLNEDTLTQHVIGAISSLDGAMTPRGLGVQGTSEIICKLSQEQKQQQRDELLSTSIKTIKSFSKFLKDGFNDKYHCVYGNEKTIASYESLFDRIRPLEQ